MHPQQSEQLNRVDIEAMEASLPEIGAVVAEIGMTKPFSEYSRDEVLRLIYSTVRAVDAKRLEIIERETIPF